MGWKSLQPLSRSGRPSAKTITMNDDYYDDSLQGTTIEFETETKRKRKLRDVLCSCCRRQRVADVSEPPLHAEVTPPVTSSDVVKDAGCCGKKREAERRDSILSDQAPST